MLTTTLKLLRKWNACWESYETLEFSLGGADICGADFYGEDTPIPLFCILKTNGLADTIWCLRATEQDFEGKVRPLLLNYLADVLEHALFPIRGEVASTLYVITLLRDPTTTREQFGQAAAAARATFDTAALWAAIAAYTSRADLAARAAYAAEASAYNCHKKNEKEYAWQVECLRAYLIKED